MTDNIPAWTEQLVVNISNGNYSKCRDSLLGLYFSKIIDFHEILRFCVSCELASSGTGGLIIQELENVCFPNIQELELEFKRCVDSFREENN